MTYPVSHIPEFCTVPGISRAGHSAGRAPGVLPHEVPRPRGVTGPGKSASDSKLGTGEESGSIRVKNKWGDTTTESFSCG